MLYHPHPHLIRHPFQVLLLLLRTVLLLLNLVVVVAVDVVGICCCCRGCCLFVANLRVDSDEAWIQKKSSVAVGSQIVP